MWNPLSPGVTADLIATTAGRVVAASARSGELVLVDPAGAAPPELLADGWRDLRGLAADPDSGRLVAVDGAGRLWTDLAGAAAPVPDVRFGDVVQVAAAAGRVLVLDRADRRSPWPRPLRPRAAAPDRQRYRLTAVDAAAGTSEVVTTDLLGARGLAISPDGALAYVADDAGTIVAVPVGGDNRSVVATGLDGPGRFGWINAAAGLLGVAVAPGVEVLDVAGAAHRTIPFPAGRPRDLVRSGQQVVVAAGGLWVIDAADLTLDRVMLGPPAGAVHIGGYARVGVSLGTSGVTLDDLTFDVAEGPAFGGVSRSRDAAPDPARPQVVLLAGPHPGRYTVRALDAAGAEVTRAPFDVTGDWTAADGPNMAFTGANRVYASGGTWGSVFGGLFPFEFTFGVNAVSGIRRVALIFVNTSDVTLPAGTQKTYRDALSLGVPGTDGVLRSVAAYYREISDGRLTIVPIGEATVTLNKTWAEYTEQFSKTDARFGPKQQLIGDAMWQAQATLDFHVVDTALFVVASPNGGVPLPPVQGPPGTPPVPQPARFCWPLMSSGTYVLNSPAPPLTLLWWWKSLPWVVMPAEWESLDPRRAFETLTHEIGHTIGLPDLYDDPRSLNGYEVMVNETSLPQLTLPLQTMLGWVDPAALRRFNFRVENPVDETVTLTATERLGTGGPPAGERAGVAVEVADGWRYYFEYRSRQNSTAATPVPTQVADQGIPEDRRVVATDVVAGWYAPPVLRKPVRFLGDDGDGEGPVLSVGEDYSEVDVTGNAVFTLDMLSADDARAQVRVRYQPIPAPEPPWPNGPDPSIRPWPGGGVYQSPDILVTNKLGAANIPWAGHSNTIHATVSNSGVVDALGVRVGFWVKDFTASSSGPETFLGWAPAGTVPAGGSKEFTMPWTPPNVAGFLGGPLGFAHYCVVVRIAPHSQGTPPRGEVSTANNEAQSNYTILFTIAGSPFDRPRLPVMVTNPYPNRAVTARLNVEQSLDHFRTYVGATSLQLAPGESRSVELMVECIADEPPFVDTVPEKVLYGTPNLVSAIALIDDGTTSDMPTAIGGATIEVRAGRRTSFQGLDVSAANASGTVVGPEGRPVAGGEVVLATQAASPVGEIVHRTSVGPDGRFALASPDLAAAVAAAAVRTPVEVFYLGRPPYAPCSTEVTVG